MRASCGNLIREASSDLRTVQNLPKSATCTLLPDPIVENVFHRPFSSFTGDGSAVKGMTMQSLFVSWAGCVPWVLRTQLASSVGSGQTAFLRPDSRRTVGKDLARSHLRSVGHLIKYAFRGLPSRYISRHSLSPLSCWNARPVYDEFEN